MAAGSVNENIRYEPEDNPPAPVAIGVGFQAAALTLAPVAITVVIRVPYCGTTRRLYFLGSIRRLVGQRHNHHHSSRAAVANWRRTRAVDGHLGRLHRGLRSRPGTRRPCPDGQPHRTVVAVPVPYGRSPLAIAPDIHPSGHRYGDYADSGHSYAHRLRHAGRWCPKALLRRLPRLRRWSPSWSSRRLVLRGAAVACDCGLP